MAVGHLRTIAALLLASAVGFAGAAPASAADDDTPVNPASVAVILPITIPVTTDEFVNSATGGTHFGTFLSAQTLEQATLPNGSLSMQLDAAINRGVTLAIDPMVIASIRRLGVSAPASATQWLDRLATASNDTFLLSYADSDITAALQAGRDEVLRPASLDFAIDPTLFPATTPTQAPDATSPPVAAPELPTTDDLLSWNTTLPSIAWPQADSVVESDLTAISDSGYDTTILASKNITRSRKTAGAATIDGSPVLITDETISSLLDSVLSAQSEKSWDSSMDALAAAVTSYSQRGLDTTLVLALDRTQPISTGNLARTVDALDELSEADVVGLHDITQGQSTKATLVDQPQSATRIARVEQLLLSNALDRQFSRIAETPQLITSERRLRLLVILSPAATEHAGGWGAATEEFLRESETLRASVQLIQRSEIILGADNSSLPFYVTNALNQPVTVYITVRPSLPLVAIADDRIAVTIEAGTASVPSQTKVAVPVQSLTNGEVQLQVSLHTDVDLKVRVGGPSKVALSVRAGWEGPVTVVLAVLVVLLFLFGIFRTVVRRRAANRAAGQ